MNDKLPRANKRPSPQIKLSPEQVRHLETKENARWVEGYEGLYKITNTGKVISYKYQRPRLLYQHVNNWGYLSVVFRHKDQRSKSMPVHRLVAKAFCPGYQKGLTVNHKDLNKLNNHFTNLEWVTSADNSRHAWRSGACAHVTKNSKKRVKATNPDTGEELIFESICEAGKMGFQKSNISRYASKGWLCHGYRWTFI